MAKWEKIIEVRTVVNGVLETARAEKKIGKALEAAVALTVPAEDAFLAEMDAELLADLLIVSQVSVTVGAEVAASVENAAGEKCPRCWKHSTTPGTDNLCPRCAAVVATIPEF
jgi:isoleucyl-tRNA synthetase